MKLEFGYGKDIQTVDVPDKNLMAVLTANEIRHERRGSDAVDYALEHPIGAPKLSELAKPGMKVSIITSDISRPIPSYEVLPSVLRELNAAGIPDSDIAVVFALGSHRPQTEEEKKKLAGDEVYERVRCIDSDPDDCILMGKSSNGTPFSITRSVAEADFRIALGNIEFHYFAGYSGGVKALMPGVSTPEAIRANHSLMVSPDACAGKLEGNPVREDLEEALSFCPIHYIVNAVLDEHKHIVYAVAGDVIKAHREGCRYLDEMYRKPIPERADIVLVSQGGAPKDANLYQTQKALDNSRHAVADGGTIILIGACNEGLGSDKFKEWLVGAEESHDMVERIKYDFQLGGHKAAAIGMVLDRARIDLVSEMDDEFVRSIFLNPQPSAQAAFDEAMERYGPDATVIAMPFGGATLPMEDKKKAEKTGGERAMDYASKSLELHEEWKGKIEVTSRVPVKTKDDLSLAYTPGVAQPCLEIQKDLNKSYRLTRRSNLCAVVTDGTAVLGLGDIGPEAGMPVMEGKCVLFKEFGDVDAFPLCVRSKDVDTIVNTVAMIAGSFGGINLEDISAPRCFEIERKLKEKCDIPVFHDDQHGTAVITLAGLTNACKIVGKEKEEMTIVISGAGAAAISIARLLLIAGYKDVIMCDRRGAIYKGRKEGMNWIKQEMATITNNEMKKGTLADVLEGADVFIGVSAPGILTKAMIKTMAKDPIIFACANPTPEIFPDEAKVAGAAVVATGRSDFPNQINNVLAFPGIFRGAFDVHASDINDHMKLSAARALADLISDEERNADYIIPKAFDPRVGPAVAAAVSRAAIESGVARTFL